MKDLYFSADDALLTKCMELCGETIYPNKMIIGRVVCGQRFVSDLKTKIMLHDNMSADCVEMEGAAIAHACYLTKTPYLIIRSISDCLNDVDENSSLSFRTFLNLASAQLTKILEKLILSI